MKVKDDVDFFLDQYNKEVQLLFQKTRALIKAQIPTINEQLDLPAKMLAYTFGKKYEDVICTIILSKKGVKLGFYKGAELPDPKKILAGTGKIHKYVEMTERTNVNAVKKLLNAAYKTYVKRKEKSI
ncbi:MAG: DUF1801 domain-containing protein [Bacteroidia bacterium]|nr:DUF1801 domain-containing protein [Bacteroidia bacterium]